jgi:hypothetical protein
MLVLEKSRVREPSVGVFLALRGIRDPLQRVMGGPSVSAVGFTG